MTDGINKTRRDAEAGRVFETFIDSAMASIAEKGWTRPEDDGVRLTGHGIFALGTIGGAFHVAIGGYDNEEDDHSLLHAEAIARSELANDAETVALIRIAEAAGMKPMRLPGLSFADTLCGDALMERCWKRVDAQFGLMDAIKRLSEGDSTAVDELAIKLAEAN